LNIREFLEQLKKDNPAISNKAFAFVAAREKVNDEDYLRQGEKRSC